MTKDKHTTDVIFRRFKDGELIALFPALPGTRDPFTCDSYQHVGQHGSASVDLISETKPAGLQADVLALEKELEGLGYRLRVVKRFTASHHSARRAELNRKA